MLPDADGLDICKGIRGHAELSHVPIIFLTARATETDRIVGILKLGANDYIVKPFFIRELVARVKTNSAPTPVPLAPFAPARSNLIAAVAASRLVAAKSPHRYRISSA